MPISIGNIVQDGDPVLRDLARPVPVADIGSRPVRELIAKMKEELSRHDDGVAIAAPQLGASVRIFVVSGKAFAISEEREREGDSEEDRPRPTGPVPDDLVCINPRIVRTSKKRAWIPEGCLSVRWKYGEAYRADKATIEAYDESGVKFTRGGSGLIAQIFQHETDHLNGILFIDHARSIEEVVPEELEREREPRRKRARS